MSKNKYLKQGKYLDDINWINEIVLYVNSLKSSNIKDIKCEQVGLKLFSPYIKSKKEYILEKADKMEMIELAKDFYQWSVMDKLTNSSPHLKKLFNLIFYCKSIYPYTFYYDEDMFYDYDYINSICEDIDEAFKKLKKMI